MCVVVGVVADICHMHISWYVLLHYIVCCCVVVVVCALFILALCPPFVLLVIGYDYGEFDVCVGVVVVI